jgi:hypothetical protein
VEEPLEIILIEEVFPCERVHNCFGLGDFSQNSKIRCDFLDEPFN